MHDIRNFLWICSGATISILKKTPSESAKYTGIGGVVFFTGLLAGLAAAYALYTVFDSIIASVIFGLIWGLMIFNLDRFLVSSMRKNHSFFRQLFQATPRLLLACLIAMVISKPLELKIFEKEINAELAIMQQEKLKEQEDAVKNRFTMNAESLQRETTQLHEEIAAATERTDMLRKEALAEADGTGGSMKANLGPIYKAKKAELDKAEAIRSEVIKANSVKIQANDKALEQVNTNIESETAKVERSTYDGFASRLAAIDRIATSEQPVERAQLFILLLFIAIECMPIFAKLISPKGPYDDLLMAHEYAFDQYREVKVKQLNQPDLKTATRSIKVYGT